MPKNKSQRPSNVKTRLVLNFPGFEQTDSAAQLGRLNHCLEQTGKVWGFNSTQRVNQKTSNAHHTIADHTAEGKNWKTDTRLVQFRWNDIVSAYEKASFPKGFLQNTLKYLAFFADGTVYQYLKTSARYFAFTIFPILLVIIFAALAWNIIGLLSGNFFIKFFVTILTTLGLCYWPGKSLYIPLTIADWGFARDMVHQSNGEIEERFEAFAKTVVEEIKSSNHDEIIIVGHSFGSIWAVEAIARAKQQNPKLFNGKTVTFLALGSSLLKIALAPNAKQLRAHWNIVSSDENIFWHELQTKDDLIAFFKCDPFKLPQFDEPKGGYKIEHIRFSKAMESKRYKKMRMSFYRTHRQYILNYDKRVRFDYMLRLVGPFSSKELAQNKELFQSIDNEGKLL